VTNADLLEVVIGTSTLTLIHGDITRVEVDAIVNAANSELQGGGGVDGAIHEAGGPTIFEECRRIIATIGSLEVGHAVMTTAGSLPAKKVIHTVGPYWSGGDAGEAAQLARCYRSCLEVARQNGLVSVAFPNISTGVYGFPKARAAKVALDTVVRFLDEHPDTAAQVVFVCFESRDADLYQEELRSLSARNGVRS